MLELVKKIKPTNWSYTKTDAIDFETPFIWFDDYLFEFEKEQLNKNGCFSSWVKVNLEENPDQLKDIFDLFKDLKK